MVNKNYRKGRAKEYRLKQQLERRGFIVLRSAGSHGFADLVAIHKRGKYIKFIQCKPKDLGKLARGKLEYDNAWINHKLFKTYYEIV